MPVADPTPQAWSRTSTRLEAGASLWEGLQLACYFFRFLTPDLFLVSGVIALSLLAILLRLPFMYLTAILTAHFQVHRIAHSAGGLDWPVHGMVDALRESFGTPEYLLAVVIVAFTGVLLLSPLQLIRSYWCGLLGGNLLLRLRKILFGNLKHLSMLAVYERGAGAFIQRLTRDLILTGDFFAHSLTGLVSLILYVIVYLAASLMMEWRLTLIILVAYCALQPVLMVFHRRIEFQSMLLQGLHEQLTTHLLESVGGYRDIIATGQFTRMEDRFRVQAERLRLESLRALLWSQWGELLLGLAFSLFTAVPYFLILRKINNIEDVGRLITYVGFLTSLLPSLAGLWGASIDFALVSPSLRAMRAMLEPEDAQPAMRPPNHAPPRLPESIRSIRFEGVGLQLGSRWILRDLSFRIEGGGLTAIIGQSGSGKTTIFYLLLRLLTPTCGTIWINEIPLAEFDESDLRRLIGFIPQNPFIFNSSLRDNILIACPDDGFPESSLKEVVHSAQLEDLVRTRTAEGGLDASAGYLGMQLSAGERQRIALARILVQNPSIVVCDEYTANIDVITAKLIQDMMRLRLHGRTRVVISHELYNARGADQILVLDGGRIVQSGTHADLLKDSGLYRTMWEAQRIE